MEEDPGRVSDQEPQESTQAPRDPRLPPAPPEEEEDWGGLSALREAQITESSATAAAAAGTGLLTPPSMPLFPSCERSVPAVHFVASGSASCEGFGSDTNWTDPSSPPSHPDRPHQPGDGDGDEAALEEQDILKGMGAPLSPSPCPRTSDEPGQEREEEPRTDSPEHGGLTRGELKDVKDSPKELLTGESQKATEGTQPEPTAHSGTDVMATESHGQPESTETPSSPPDGCSGQEHQPSDSHAEGAESGDGAEPAGESAAALTPACSADANPGPRGGLDQLAFSDVSQECFLLIRCDSALTKDTDGSERQELEGEGVTSGLNGHEEGMKEEEEDEEEDGEDQYNLLHKSVRSQCARKMVLPVRREEAESDHMELNDHPDPTVLLNCTELPEQQESCQQEPFEQIRTEQSEHVEQPEQSEKMEHPEQSEQFELQDKSSPLHTLGPDNTQQKSPLHTLEPDNTQQSSPLYTLGPDNTQQSSPLHTLGPDNADQSSPLHTLEPDNTDQSSPLHTLEPDNTDQSSPLHTLEPDNSDQSSPLHTLGPDHTDQSSPLHKLGPDNTDQSSPLHMLGPDNSDQSSPLHTLGPDHTDQSSPLHMLGPDNSDQSSPLHTLGPDHTEKSSPLHTLGPDNAQQSSPLHTLGPDNTDQSSPLHTLGPDNSEHAKKTLEPLPTQQTEEQKLGSLQHKDRGAIDREEAHRLAEDLYRLQDVRRTDVVKYLNKDNEFSHAVGEEYLKFFDFTGQNLNQGLRSFLKVVVLLGESQERERVLEHFSHRFHQCNPDSFSSPSAVLTLTCALMLLNTDLHGQNVGKSMPMSIFISNLDGMNEGGHFCKDLLKDLYNAIKNEALEWAVDEEELKSSMVLPGDEKTDSLLRSKSNPFQDLPHDKKATVYKQGFLTRKAHADIDGKRTPWGKRRWKSFYAVLKGMVLYLQKDEYRTEWQSSAEIVSVHHALAERAADYRKRPHVFRLQTADWRVFLFQASTPEQMSSWIHRINLVSALYSSPPFPAAVGSQKRFSRPILPAMQSALTVEKQLQSHTHMLDSFSSDLTLLQQSVLQGRRAKARELEEHRQREEYLLHEKSRYEVYKQMLDVWRGLGGQVGGSVTAEELERFDGELYSDTEEEGAGLKKSHSSPSLNLELAPPPVVRVKRNISERRTYRKIIIPRRGREL